MSDKCSFTACNLQPIVSAMTRYPGDTELVEVAFCADHSYCLNVRYQSVNPAQINRTRLGQEFASVELRALLFMHDRNEFYIILGSTLYESVVAIPTGYVEAIWIRYIARGVAYPAPPTQVFVLNMLTTLRASIVEGVLYDFDNTTGSYKSFARLSTTFGEQIVEGRISDIVALSLAGDFSLSVDRVFFEQAQNK